MSASDPVRFGLIGPGKVAAEFLAPALREARRACLWSVLGRDTARTLGFAHKHGARSPAPAFTSEAAFFADPELDAVLIATPDPSHAGYVLAAVEHGKAAFVEKPMCVSTAEGWPVVKAALAAKTTVGVGYHLRHHRGLQRLAEEVHGGAIGAPHHMRVQWTYRSPRGAAHWRASRANAPSWSLGAFGTHCLDLILWTLVPLCGEVVHVRSLATHAVWRAENDETAIAILQFASGTTAELICSVLFESESRVEIFGDRGTAVADGALGGSGGGRVRIGGSELQVEAANPYGAEIDHFAECVRDGRRPAVDAAEGLRNVQLLDAIAAAGALDARDAVA